MAPIVSVVTPSFNHAQFLPMRVASVLGQTMLDFEWIIIDDCSSDGSQEELRRLVGSDPRVTLLFHSNNMGMPATTREAIELSTGKYVYRAESDDACDVHFLERMVAIMEAHPEVGFAYCRSLYMNDKNELWGGRRQGKEDKIWKGNDLFSSIVMGTSICGGNILFSRAAHDSVGGFGSGPFRVSSDWHFTLRMCLEYDAAYVSEPLGYHRVHRSNLSRVMKENFELETLFRESYQLLNNVFELVAVERPELCSLQPDAIRSASHRIAPLYVQALLAGKRTVASAIKDGVEYYDPGATKERGWIKAAFLGFLLRSIHEYVYSPLCRVIDRRRGVYSAAGLSKFPAQSLSGHQA